MAYTAPVPSSIYRPKKLPRVIRRQLPVLRLIAFIVLAGFIAVAVTWRNLVNERLRLDVGYQQSKIETLKKELQQLDGQIKVEASYSKLAKWAFEKHGWRANKEHVSSLILQDSALSDAAKREAELLGIFQNEPPR